MSLQPDYVAQTWKFMDACLGTHGCENCGETDEFTPDIEAFEVTGKLLCGLCAEDALAEGEGA